MLFNHKITRLQDCRLCCQRRAAWGHSSQGCGGHRKGGALCSPRWCRQGAELAARAPPAAPGCRRWTRPRPAACPPLRPRPCRPAGQRREVHTGRSNNPLGDSTWRARHAVARAAGPAEIESAHDENLFPEVAFNAYQPLPLRRRQLKVDVLGMQKSLQLVHSQRRRDVSQHRVPAERPN